MQYKYLLKFALFFFLLLPFFAQLKAENNIDPNKHYIAVSNQNGFNGPLDQKSLRGFFTLKRTVWPNGQPVQIVTLTSDNLKHKAFVENELKLFNYQVKRIWDRQIFSGSSLTPIEVNTFEELIKVIASTPGSLGYVTQPYQQAIKNENITAIAIK